tara:strand:- start:69 stop:260 length:192 start_codon:yes stop_codon:yes gene_type:complete
MHSNAKIQGQYGGNLDDFVMLLSKAQYSEYNIEYANNVITMAANNDQKNTPIKQHTESQIRGS